MAIVSLATAGVMDLAMGPYQGQETGESALWGALLGSLHIITTLVDAEEYTQEDIAELYGFRWNIALEITCISTVPFSADPFSARDRTSFSRQRSRVERAVQTLVISSCHVKLCKPLTDSENGQPSTIAVLIGTIVASATSPNRRKLIQTSLAFEITHSQHRWWISCVIPAAAICEPLLKLVSGNSLNRAGRRA